MTRAKRPFAGPPWYDVRAMKHHASPRVLGFVVLGLALLPASCASPSGSNAAEKRESIEKMRDDTLAELARRNPAAREEVAKAVGYACFSSVGATVLFVGGSGGYGVVVDGATSSRTYMKAGSGEVGIGLGAKDFRIVLAFRDADAMKDFVDGRWDFGGSADAAGRVGEGGDSAGGVTNFRERVKVWQFTEQGILLAATLKGMKFSRYDELN
jgi:lipid-binding SYLF domain-containing protein